MERLHKTFHALKLDGSTHLHLETVDVRSRRGSDQTSVTKRLLLFDVAAEIVGTKSSDAPMPVPIDAGFRLINGMADGLLLANYSFSQKAIPLNGDSPTSATLQKAARPVTATEHTHPFAIDPAVFADTRSGNGRTVADHAVLRHW